MNESSATAKLKFAKKTSKELINLFNSHVRIHANVIQDQLTEFKRNIENICIVEQILHNQLTGELSISKRNFESLISVDLFCTFCYVVNFLWLSYSTCFTTR